MKHSNRYLAAGLAFLAALLSAACSGNSTTSTVTPSTPAPALANVAGQYHGSVTDSVFGGGRGLGDFSQSGSAVGGRLRSAYASKTVLNSVAMVVSRSNSLSGTAIATIGRAACTFSVSGTYDATTFHLNGSYSAIHGCANETGSFALKEACYYRSAIASPAGAAARRRPPVVPDGAGLHAC